MISMNKPKRLWALPAGPAVIVVLVAGLLHSSPSIGAPGVTWTPSSITQEIALGQNLPLTASFVASENLSNVNVRVVPALRALVQVNPSSFASLQKGTPVTVTVTLAAPTTTPIGTTSGTIHLVSGKSTISKPLPVNVTYRGDLPPDPGEVGKTTVEGVDSNANGVRDDVERWIGFNVQDSARKRANLMVTASTDQRGMVSTTKEEAMVAANDGVLSIECFSYLGIPKAQRRWKEVLAITLNTEARLAAFDAYQDKISGATFGMVSDGQERSACKFNVEALPN